MVFHFLASHRHAKLRRTILTTFPYLNFHLYHFDTNLVCGKNSSAIRRALDQPLNYARIYLPVLLPSRVHQIIYFDSNLIVVDDVAKIWVTTFLVHPSIATPISPITSLRNSGLTQYSLQPFEVMSLVISTRSNGYRRVEMERREVYREARVVDEDTEEAPYIRAGFVAAVSAGFCRRRERG
ncbi:hypothetical protein HHK36_025233 [Tetracentron sinense]|uniref:Hexosyltransferase n=1 Tax=Tetracentron sinense TaxID=13715 RepID=A0A835D5F6_TETSI|nr:hypothetical protein HHK36_025233 [Tetracentron sinense]